MSLTDLSATTVQSIAWKEENESIPENHLNDIMECALNMPSTPHSLSNTKQWSVWVPHREGLLEEALSCTATWSSNCMQDTFFRNAKTVLVYIVKETEHIKNTHPARAKAGPHMSRVGYDDEMDQIIKNDWGKTKKIIDDQLADEQSKKNKKNFDNPPPHIIPFWGWNPEHLTQLNINVGLALGASVLKVRELGYWHQFHTAYRDTTSWHTRFGNKFNQDGKWWPFAIQIIGTNPAGAKINSRAATPVMRPDAHTIEFGENPAKQSSASDNFLGGDQVFPVLRGSGNYPTFKKNLPQTLPDHHIKFFMEYYGKYSSNPRNLFKIAFGQRVGNCEKILDEWIAKNN